MLPCRMIVLLMLAVAACTNDVSPDRPVTLHLTNSGAETMSCHLMFGHWVDRDLGRLAPGEGVDIAITQQGSDGALFVLRDDGARRMMIETINCGRDGQWMGTFGQVDLAPARRRTRCRDQRSLCRAERRRQSCMPCHRTDTLAAQQCCFCQKSCW